METSEENEPSKKESQKEEKEEEREEEKEPRKRVVVSASTSVDSIYGEETMDPDELEDVKDNSWMVHSLTFEKERKVKDPMREDKYTSYDPLKYKDVKPMSQHKRRLLGMKNEEQW